MPESTASVVTFPNCEGGYAELGGLFRPEGVGMLLHASYDRLTDAKYHVAEACWGMWRLSGEREDFVVRYPGQSGLLRQTISDPVSEIAEVIRTYPFGSVQPLGDESTCLAGMIARRLAAGEIVQRFVLGDDPATIAQALLSRFPDRFDNRSAIALVENAIRVIQTARPGWKRQVLTPDEEAPSISDNPAEAPVEAEEPIEAEVPPEAETAMESETENIDVEASPNSSTDPRTRRIPISELFSSSEPSATIAEPPGKQRYGKSSHTMSVGSAERLFEYPHLRRFVPTA